MARNTADLLLTDPPYNVHYEGEAGAIQNDNMEPLEFVRFLADAFINAKTFTRPGGAFYIWHASKTVHEFETALKQAGIQTRQQLIWNKNTFTMGRQDYQWKHEPCLYGWFDGAAHYFLDDRTQSTVFEDKGIDLKKLEKDEMLTLLKEIFSDKISTTIISEDKPSRNVEHPTMKPIRLIARLIENSTQPKEIVLDLFGGSGSTLIAAEQLNRDCFMMECDPVYCDVIIHRWEILTGNKAVLL